MAGNDQTLIDGVRAKSPPIYPMVYPQTKAEVVQHYQQTYGKSWRTHLQGDLSPFTTSKSGKPMTPKNLARRFDPSRLHNVPRTKKEKAQYEALGKTLKPTPDTSKPPTYRYPPGGMKINFRGEIKISEVWKRADFTISASASGLVFGGMSSGSEHAAAFLVDPGGWDVMHTYFLWGEMGAVDDYEGTFTVT